MIRLIWLAIENRALVGVYLQQPRKQRRAPMNRSFSTGRSDYTDVMPMDKPTEP
jgi:hypothetical protein